MTPEGWPANELLLNAETLTQKSFNDVSVTEEEDGEEEQLRVLRETNHHSRGLLQTEGAGLELKTILWEKKSMQHAHHKICE